MLSLFVEALPEFPTIGEGDGDFVIALVVRDNDATVGTLGFLARPMVDEGLGAFTLGVIFISLPASGFGEILLTGVSF